MPKGNQVKPDKAGRPREYINPWKLFVGAFTPNWLMERKEILPGTKLCYGQLCQHAGKDGNCYPSQQTLAKELGCTSRQVRTYIAELVKHKVIEVKRVGVQRNNRYFFLKHSWMGQSDRNYTSYQDRKQMLNQDRKDTSYPIVKESFKKNQPTNQKNQVGWLSNSTQKESFDQLRQQGIKSKVATTLADQHNPETILDVIQSVNESGGVKNYPGLIVDRLNTIKETGEKEREIKLERQQAELQAQRERQNESERLKRQKDKEIAEFHQWQQSHPGGSWTQFALATT